jgi:hypothetical protein
MHISTVGSYRAILLEDHAMQFYRKILQHNSTCYNHGLGLNVILLKYQLVACTCLRNLSKGKLLYD